MRIKPLFALLLTLGVYHTQGQESFKGPVIICPAETQPHEHYVPRPERMNSQYRTNAGAADPVFEVEYVWFSEEAKEAFQYAVDIWESILKTDVKIRVKATWENLGDGVLGAAQSTVFYRDFANAPMPNTWYPVALAEKLAGQGLNASSEYDIEASFNSQFNNWYLGLDGQGSGQYDLVSVVLHELGHGLGFISGEEYNEDDDTGRWDLSGTNFPMVYTSFLENSGKTNILDLPNNTTQVGAFLTSNNVFVSSDLVNKSNGGPARIYAPNPYDLGSSISHWDENTFSNTENALMTPAVAPSEVLHSPGPLTLAFFAEMGWFRTDIRHDPLLVASNSTPLHFQVEVESDTSLVDAEFTLNYFYQNGDTTSVILTKGDNGIYTSEVTPDQEASSLFYYFDGLEDALGKSYRIPEAGSYETKLQTLSLITPPFLSSDGGNFEAGAASFVSAGSTQSDQLWELGTVSSKFDDYLSTAWATSLSEPVAKPSESIESALISPLFDLRNEEVDYELSFDYLSEFSEFDFVGVYYSLDSGVTWNKLGRAFDDLGANWYSKLVYGDFFGGTTRDSEDVHQLKTATYPLYNLVGNVVMFKISHLLLASSSDEYNNEGFLVDNFQIKTTDPKAVFYSPDTTFNFPNGEVRFFYASSGATGYSWDFGDGTTSSEKNPVHSYTQGGSFDVSLSVTHPNGTSDFSRENYITVINRKGSTYQLADGGDFESSLSDFIPITVSGTGFVLGASAVAGKDGVNSGDNAWVTGPTVNEYENDSEAYLYTPEFDFSLLGSYEISFYAKYSFENLWDGFIVEYTIDRGQTWNKLDDEVRTGWYDGQSDPDAVFGPQVPIFTGTTSGFEQKSSDVSFLGGNENVSFRFTFLSDVAVTDAGLALDDFELLGPEEGSVVPAFSSQQVAGSQGCEGVTYEFSNKSTGSVAGLSWFFGEDANPTQATGVGPHVVEFPSAGSYEVVLSANDMDLNIVSVDTVFNISALHEPIITQQGTGTKVQLTLSDGDTYQWYLNDQTIEGATGQLYEAVQSGLYSGDVTIGQCTVRATSIAVVASADSNVTVKAYPNPSTEYITLDIFKPYHKLEIYNLKGQKVIERRIGELENRIVLSDNWRILPPATYVMVLYTNTEESIQFKVLKE